MGMSTGSQDSGQQPPASRVDLARMRHELRTPINHILGYCEMLVEESRLPASAAEDLRRIHAGGRELQALIARYFDEQGFSEARDLHHLYHELRTPVNHIVGYSDLLIEQADELGAQSAVPDLRKIREAATNWLGLMEAYLIEPAVSPAAGEPTSTAPANLALTLNLGFTFRVPEPNSSKALFKDDGAILIVDDDESSREMLTRRLRRCGYTVSAVGNGLQALSLARSQRFDLLMLDMIMPGLDGFQVLAKVKADVTLRDIPVIMLSALDEENGIARCIEMGAEDYLAKPFNSTFLRARIGACLEKKRLRDRERATYEALLKSQKRLAAELAEAATYVRSLLPAPLSGAVQGEWCFQPSEQLGGDAFGYHWMDEDHLAIYLLDVCGHGVGAALLSVAVLNTIRAENLAGVDFRQAGTSPCRTQPSFPDGAPEQSLLYSVVWGLSPFPQGAPVCQECGNPPALLLAPGLDGTSAPRCGKDGRPRHRLLRRGPYTDAIEPVPSGARLLVFSDGVFEIFQGTDRVGTWQEYATEFQSVPSRICDLKSG